jgi:secondary thiamine-phosphate synthase enzyme
MICFQDQLDISTKPRGLHDITRAVARVVSRSGVRMGSCVVFVRHTSASLVIQENADPAVLRDLDRWIAQVAPEGGPCDGTVWEHSAEGPDDMPAHARAAMTKTSETIPISDGELALGTWQALYLWEHRAHGHNRHLVVHVSGIG